MTDRAVQWDELLQQAENADWDSTFFDEDGPLQKWPGRRALMAATLSGRERTHSWRQSFPAEMSGRPPDERDALPRWPSTIEVIDRTYGGFFGMTALISEPGIGKSMLAISSALQAAATGRWNVKFFGSEVDDDEIVERRNREMRVHPEAIAGADFFEFIHVGKGQSVQDLVIDMCEIDPELPVLVVVDSINTTATLCGGDYLRTLNDLCMWLAFSRKLSRGAFSALVISETNKRGNSKGEKLEFWSDLALNMKGKQDETDVDFRISKIRRGRWVPLPKLTRHWPSGRFYSFEQLQAIHSRRMQPPKPIGVPIDDERENIDLF